MADTGRLAAELAAIRERARTADALLGVPADTGHLLAAVEAVLQLAADSDKRRVGWSSLTTVEIREAISRALLGEENSDDA